jgi:putative aldouronate transport system substrate-binding protein
MSSCGNKQADKQSENAAGQEITEIIWQYPSPGNLGVGFQEMEDALNEMMERDIGVHVTFHPVALGEAQQKAMLSASSGEQLDISLTAFTTVGTAVDSGLLIPIDELIEKYGADIKEQCGVLLDGCYYEGKLYGVPSVNHIGNAYGFEIFDDIAKKYGFTLDENKKYTLTDVEAVFAKVKAGEGPNFYCYIPDVPHEGPLGNAFIEYDRVSGSTSAGVLMLNRSFTDLTLHNLYETDEYKQYARKMYDWAQKGYIAPDAAVTTDFSDTLMHSGNYLGRMYWYQPKAVHPDTGIFGRDVTVMKLIDDYVAFNAGNLCQWNIPVTSGNPEKAIQALNYIHKVPEATWLIQFGIEGKSYKVIEDGPDGKVIQYLNEDTTKLPYFNPYGLWGNRLEWPAVWPSPANMNKIIREIDQAIPVSRYSPALGYNFVQESVASEIAAINAVIAQYIPGINCGTADPDIVLPRFIAALKAAGIDRVIAENQKQLNAWAAAKK